jgi:hypothetical protein
MGTEHLYVRARTQPSAEQAVTPTLFDAARVAKVRGAWRMSALKLATPGSAVPAALRDGLEHSGQFRVLLACAP